MLLTTSRPRARVRDGELVSLADHDRSSWEHRPDSCSRGRPCTGRSHSAVGSVRDPGGNPRRVHAYAPPLFSTRRPLRRARPASSPTHPCGAQPGCVPSTSPTSRRGPCDRGRARARRLPYTFTRTRAELPRAARRTVKRRCRVRPCARPVPTTPTAPVSAPAGRLEASRPDPVRVGPVTAAAPGPTQCCQMPRPTSGSMPRHTDRPRPG